MWGERRAAPPFAVEKFSTDSGSPINLDQIYRLYIKVRTIYAFIGKKNCQVLSGIVPGKIHS